MTSHRTTALVAVVVGLAGFAVSIGRVLLANHDALTNLVWAEDGLFPLCARVHGVIPCAVDPYSGYLLVLPRLIAWPVSWFPLDSWPTATNVAAAIVAGGMTASVFLVLRARGSGWSAAVVVAILPVIVPVAGFEAVNTTASVNVYLLYLATIMLSFPASSTPPWVYPVLLLIAALTVPSAVVLLVPLIAQGLRHRIPWRRVLLASGALCLGMVAQGVAVVTAATPRSVSMGLPSIVEWMTSIPHMVISLAPGSVHLSSMGRLVADSVVGADWIGPVVVAAILVLGILLVARDGDVVNGIGLLILTGLAAGAVPSLIGVSNHRYLIVTLLLLLASAVIALDAWAPRRELVVSLAGTGLVVLWMSTLPASEYRSTAMPSWPDMLRAARVACSGEPSTVAVLQFAPMWPDVGARFRGVTSNVAPCSLLEP